jgi:hypothetical protein
MHRHGRQHFQAELSVAERQKLDEDKLGVQILKVMYRVCWS